MYIKDRCEELKKAVCDGLDGYIELILKVDELLDSIHRLGAVDAERIDRLREAREACGDR